MVETKWYNKDILRSFKAESRSYMRGIQSIDVCLSTKIVINKLMVMYSWFIKKKQLPININ